MTSFTLMSFEGVARRRGVASSGRGDTSTDADIRSRGRLRSSSGGQGHQRRGGTWGVNLREGGKETVIEISILRASYFILENYW